MNTQNAAWELAHPWKNTEHLIGESHHETTLMKDKKKKRSEDEPRSQVNQFCLFLMERRCSVFTANYFTPDRLLEENPLC